MRTPCSCPCPCNAHLYLTLSGFHFQYKPPALARPGRPVFLALPCFTLQTVKLKTAKCDPKSLNQTPSSTAIYPNHHRPSTGPSPYPAKPEPAAFLWLRLMCVCACT